VNRRPLSATRFTDGDEAMEPPAEEEAPQ
jgi:hypothetical protein